jgi:hypothetical protein
MCWRRRASSLASRLGHGELGAECCERGRKPGRDQRAWCAGAEKGDCCCDGGSCREASQSRLTIKYLGSTAATQHNHAPPHLTRSRKWVCPLATEIDPLATVIAE